MTRTIQVFPAVVVIRGLATIRGPEGEAENAAYRAVWVPAARCAWWLESPDVAVLKPKVTLASVAALVSSADAACPWTVLVPSSKQI